MRRQNIGRFTYTKEEKEALAGYVHGTVRAKDAEKVFGIRSTQQLISEIGYVTRHLAKRGIINFKELLDKY